MCFIMNSYEVHPACRLATMVQDGELFAQGSCANMSVRRTAASNARVVHRVEASVNASAATNNTAAIKSFNRRG